MQRKLIKLLLVAALALPARAVAQARTVEVHVPTNMAVTNAVGLLMTGGRTIQKAVASMNQLAEDVLVVTFPYDAAELDGESFASALVVGAEGEVRYGEVKLVAGNLTSKSFLTLPECPAKEVSKLIGHDQTGLIESLVEIRAARREAHQLRISTTMQGAFLEKLQRLEKGFGFLYAKKLAPDLPPTELADRLSRLTNAIKNYQNSVKN